MLKLEKEEEEKEKQRILAEKQEKALQRKRKRVICCQKFCCFKDEDGDYDLKDKMPTTIQVCCWRFLRSRR